MSFIQSAYDLIKEQIPLITTIITVAVLIGLFNLVMGFVKKGLLLKAKSKKQISNIKIFARMLNVTFSIIVLLFAFFSYIGSWTGLGIVAGLLTAALGFALQKPITGIAAWIMVILKRPFSIGDRIKIGEVKGEVYDISLTHIYIDEVGGLINSEELSGRNIMVPNYLLFEQNIINYTMIHDYVISEVTVNVTYDSNLDKAMKIVKEETLKHVSEHAKVMKKDPQVRISMDTSGITIKSRFFAPVKGIQKTASEITKAIYDSFKKQKDIKFAFVYAKQ